MSRRLNHDDSMKFNATSLISNRKDVANALKEIQKEGHDTIENVNELYEQIKTKKKERVSTLKRNWSKNVERFWQLKLSQIRHSRAEYDETKQKEMRQLKKQIHELERREKQLCGRLNSKLDAIHVYQQEL